MKVGKARCLAAMLSLGLAASLAVACGERESSPPAEGENAQEAPASTELPEQVLVIDPVGGAWLSERGAQQRARAEGWQVEHDFRFADGLERSGISWVHQTVPDAAKAYKAVHYDHGNGVAAADVDGDEDLDLYFTNQAGTNGLWLNRGDGTFEDSTWESGVPVFDRVSVTASFADTDNDGDSDLYVTSVRDGNLLFVNDGKGRFTDATADSGLGYQGHSSGAVFFDYDRDGLLDLFLTNVGVYTTQKRGDDYWIGFGNAFSGHTRPERFEASRLYRNLGANRFEDVTEALGLKDVRWSGDASPIDANDDGWLDLYVLNMQGLDGYWENVEGKRFVDKTAEKFPRSSWGAMGIQVFDWDNDGDSDVFVTDMHSDMWEAVAAGDMHEWVGVPPTQAEEKRNVTAEFILGPDMLLDNGNGIYGNSAFRNDEGQFVEVTQQIGAENYWPWGLSSGDLNADGYVDVFITSSMNYPFRYAVNSLMLNDRGDRFLDAEFVLGVEPRAGGGVHTDWFDLDCSSDEDRYHRHCEETRTKGRIRVRGALGSRSSVLFDLEGDGDLDIVTSEFGSAPQVLVSNLSEQGDLHFLKIRLLGSRSNRDGLGARVTVEAGGNAYTQQHFGRSGYLSQSAMPLYFGLADATVVDEIQVRWPSGQEQTLSGPIQANQQLSIEEPRD